MTGLERYSKTCRICGKEFICWNPTKYSYKRPKRNDTIYFCSYKCLRKYDNGYPTLKYNKIAR